MHQRLQKIIGAAGICSRRRAEELILAKRVFVNNKLASLGDKADEQIDVIKIDEYIIPKVNKSKVILLNKPAGIVCSCNDNQGRKTVLDLLPNTLRQGMYPIGRLDMYSRGAIILTNNGFLTLQLTHPRYKHTKTYKVLIKGRPNKEVLQKWKNGVIIDGKKTKEAKIFVMKNLQNKTLLEVEISEGRNRQIRKIGSKLGHEVIDLQRTKIANIKLDGLKEGNWRSLDKIEWQYLLN